MTHAPLQQPVRRLLAELIVFFGIAFAAFGPTLTKPYMLDDPFLITGNERVHHWSVDRVKGDFTQSYYPDHTGAYFRPLQHLYIRAVYTLSSGRAVAFHLLNVVSVALNGLLLLGLLSRLNVKRATARLAALLWAVHPIIVHEVLAASQTDLWATMFLLGCLTLLLDERRLVFVAGWALAGVALLWKESSLGIPFYYILVASVRGLRREIIGRRFGLLLSLWIPYFLFRHSYIVAVPALTIDRLVRFSVVIGPSVLTHYAKTLLWPFALETWPLLHHPGIWAIAHATVWVLITGILIRKRSYGLLACLAWFAGSIALRIPAMIVNGVLMDHWGYSAGIGLIVPLVILSRQASAQQGRFYRRVAACGLGAAFIGCVALSEYHLFARGSDEKNFRWTLRFQRPTFVEYRLGVLLLNSGRAQEAVPFLKSLAQEFPKNPDFQNAYALAAWKTGHPEDAEATLKALLNSYPDYEPARANLREMRSRESSLSVPAR